MSHNRWKLLAGVLGISIVGLVAMANPQCPNVAQKDATREKAPTAKTPDPRPVAILPVSQPQKDTARVPQPITRPVEILPFSLPDVAPPPVTFAPIPSGKSVELPALELPVSSPNSLPSIVLTPPAVAAVVPLPVQASPPVFQIELPKITVAPEVKIDLSKVDADRVFVKLTPTPDLPAETPRTAIPPKVELPAPTPIVEKAPRLEPPTPSTVKKSEFTSPIEEYAIRTSEEPQPVRVVVQIGTGQAQFLVLRGEETLLKGTSDSIEVRSPSEKSNHMTPLKAGGKVKFSAPGCEGTCDSLQVQPVTGEVELTGTVSVQCRQGKGETQMNGSSMKFKFGSVPTVEKSSIPTGQKR